MSISTACSEEHRPLAAYGLLTAVAATFAAAAPQVPHTEAMPS